MKFKVKELDAAYERLIRVCVEHRAKSTRLKYWSRFVRMRDGYKCLACGESGYVAAHHIIRKSFLPMAQYLPGNGVSLCRDCHKEVHEGFNGKPDLSLPMDHQGGEKIEVLVSLFRLLSENSVGRNSDYYSLHKEVISRFKVFQGYDPSVKIYGNDVEQAYKIWRSCPSQVRDALLEANGFPSSHEKPLSKVVTVFFDNI